MSIGKIFKAIAYKIVWWTGFGLIRLLIDLELRGKVNIPAKGPYILVSNHLSYLDPMMVHSISRKQLRFFIAAEYYHDRRWKWFYDFFGCIPVTKGMINARAIEEAIKAILSGDSFVIFPEGSISETGKLRKWHPGIGLLALSTGAPVIPVLLKGTADLLPLGSHKVYFRPVSVFAGRPLSFQTTEKGPFSKNAVREAAQKIRDAFIELAREKGVYDEIVGPEAEQEKIV